MTTPYGFDISTDWQVCDFLETMTLKVTGQTDVELALCVITEPYVRKEMEPAYGQVPQDDTLIVWPQSKSDKPPLGSTLVDEEGTYWTILKLTTKQHVDTYEAQCRDLSVIPSVSNTATILLATYGKGEANEAAAQWSGAVSGAYPATAADTVPARFQPLEEVAQIFLGAGYTKAAYRVIFDAPVPIELAGNEYRLVDSEGYRYRIMQYVQEQRLDRLPVAIAVRILEGTEYFDSGPESSASGS